MGAYRYDDFRVVLTARADGTYACVATDPDGAVHTGVFRMPLDDQQLERAVLDVAARATRSAPAPRDVRPAGRPDVDPERFGGALAGALLDGDVGRAYDQARAAAAGGGRGLRLTLSLAGAPALLSVPWELMYRRPRFLANQRHTPFVRHLDVPVGAEPPAIEGTVHVLGVIASPQDCTPLDVDAERSRVERAVESVIRAGRIELEWLDPATPRRLREAFRDGAYHVLHYVGHSDFTADGEGVLYLEDGAGGHALVDGTALANLLADQSSLRLVVLNSCEGARTTLTDPFAGVATTLVQLGVPAVVAMQFEISDTAAILFAEELYTNLIGRQAPIDVAVAEARKAIYIEQGGVEWATPVLFMGDPDAELFRFDAAPALAPPPAPVEPEPAPPMPPMPPASPAPVPATPRRPTRRSLMAAGVAALVVLGATAALVLRPDSGDDEGGATTTPVSAPAAPTGARATTLPDPAASVGAPAASPPAVAAAPPPVAPLTFTGSVDTADGVVEHPLELVTGQLLYLGSSSPCGPNVAYQLIAPSGTPTGAPRVCTDLGRFEVTESGPWQLRLYGYAGGMGAYSIEVAPIPPDTVTAIAVGESLAGELTAAGERHRGTFDAAAGDIVYLRGSGVCGTSLEYTLRAPSGAQVGGAPYSCNDVGRQELAETGTFSIVVDSFAGGFGTYVIDLLAVPPDRVTPVRLGDRLTGELTTPGERHRFTFEAAPGTAVTMDGLGACGPLVEYSLLSPSGGQVGGAPYTCNDFPRQELAERGTYTVLVEGFDGGIGSYDIQLSASE